MFIKSCKNLGRRLAIVLIALSSLSAMVYHDDVIAGKGNGGGNGSGNGGGNGSANGGGNAGSNLDTKSDPGISPESYGNWLSDLTKE